MPNATALLPNKELLMRSKGKNYEEFTHIRGIRSYELGEPKL
jgi:hypothetical protein